MFLLYFYNVPIVFLRYLYRISKVFLFISAVFLPYFYGVSIANAAILSLQLPETMVRVGDVFEIPIRLNTEGIAINAVETYVEFPNEYFEIARIETQNSILKLFPEDPTFSNDEGIMSITGGIATPGFSGENGLVGIIIAHAKKAGDAQLNFSPYSRALIDDGLGTESELTLVPQKITIKEGAGRPRIGASLFAEDITPPESFTPLVGQEQSMFNGKYFVVFQTTDTESGIAYYEVKEITNSAETAWEKTQSPYVLKTQSGKIRIQVRAVNNAGNATVETIEVDLGTVTPKLIALLLIIIGLGAAAIIHIKNRNTIEAA